MSPCGRPYRRRSPGRRPFPHLPSCAFEAPHGSRTRRAFSLRPQAPAAALAEGVAVCAIPRACAVRFRRIDADAAARASLHMRAASPLRLPTDGFVPADAAPRARAPSPSATEPASGLRPYGRRPRSVWRAPPVRTCGAPGASGRLRLPHRLSRPTPIRRHGALSPPSRTHLHALEVATVPCCH